MKPRSFLTIWTASPKLSASPNCEKDTQWLKVSPLKMQEQRPLGYLPSPSDSQLSLYHRLQGRCVFIVREAVEAQDSSLLPQQGCSAPQAEVAHELETQHTRSQGMPVVTVAICI